MKKTDVHKCGNHCYMVLVVHDDDNRNCLNM